MTELTIPDTAKSDPDSVEILRVWLSAGSQHVSLKPGVWDDPAAWGLMLADLARHVANSYTVQGEDREETLSRILKGFKVETEHPTDEPRGAIED